MNTAPDHLLFLHQCSNHQSCRQLPIVGPYGLSSWLQLHQGRIVWAQNGEQSTTTNGLQQNVLNRQWKRNWSTLIFVCTNRMTIQYLRVPTWNLSNFYYNVGIDNCVFNSWPVIKRAYIYVVQLLHCHWRTWLDWRCVYWLSWWPGLSRVPKGPMSHLKLVSQSFNLHSQFSPIGWEIT